MFQLIINKKIKKQILKLPVFIQIKIEDELFELVQLSHPIQHRDVKKLVGSSSQYRLRIGIHVRVLFDISKTEKLIRVIEISTRENIKY